MAPGKIVITPSLSIDEREINIQFVRASGPGGQNVNKVSTAVQLRFDVRQSPSLPEDVRQRLIHIAGKRLTKEGILVLDARRHRTQDRNRQDALKRLVNMIHLATIVPRTRFKTKPSKAVKEKRLQQKQPPKKH